MKKSPVAGISGAARVYQMTMGDITKAEKHGKRLDTTSKARAITNDPPLTTAGLNLKALYLAHSEGVFRHKARAKAMHVIIQFPKDLVDGEDADYMLMHARKFVESVFGDQAIFADRVDRDEKGRHIVDIFIAPKYIKKTLHTTQLAITVSKHQKDLAEKYGRKTTPRGTGHAMQDAVFEYFRDVMGLEGVQRGDPKVIAGPDWKSAEQLRDAELQGMKTELEKERRKVAELEQQLIEQAKTDREQVKAKQEELEAAKVAAEMQKKRATEAREIAERLQQEAETLRSQNEAASQKAAEERNRSNAEIARREANLAAELDAVAVSKKQNEADATSAAEAQRAATALMETAKAEMAQVTTKRGQLERDRDLEAAQLALLVRAADDDNGLELQAAGDRFSMAKSRMTQPERTVFESSWSTGVIAIGRKLADALETVRRTLLRLADKEMRLEQERQEHGRSFAAHQEALRAHQDAMRDLDLKIANVNDSERQIKQRLDATTEALNAARAKEREATAAKQVQDHWLTVISATASAFDKVTIDDNGKVAVAPELMVSLPEPIRSTLQKDAPDWAGNIIKERQVLAQARHQAEAAEADWKRKAAAVSADQQRIEKSRKVLDAVVSGEWDVAIADGFMTLRHDSDSESRNVRKIPLAGMEPSLLHAAQAFTHLSATTDSVLELRDSLKKERSAFAKSQPERASQIEDEQQRTDDKIGKVLRLPPGWGQGIGR